jgi:hypothetical protein
MMKDGSEKKGGLLCRWAVCLLLVLCSGGSLLAQSQVTLNQVSAPSGLLSVSTYVTTAQWTNSTTAPATVNGYSFIGWTTNGVYVRTNVASVLPSGVPGEAVNPIPIKVYGPTTITANYLPTSQDSEGLGVPDWWKMFYFGTTNLAATNIMTGDGFTLLQKYQRGYDPTQYAILEDGGISRRDSASISLLLDLNMIYFATLSDPPGLLSTSTPVYKGSSQSVSAPLASSGYQFIGWFDALGKRFDTPDGGGSATLTVGSSNTTVTASYLPAAQDINGNGVPDWWESFYLSTLTNSAASQPSGDGFTIVQDYQRGYDPRMIHQIVDGGISRRDSETITVVLVPAMAYILQSDPAGILNINTNALDSNAVTSPYLLGNQSGGYQFAYWSVGGAIQTNADGSAMGQLTFTPTNGFIATAKYVPQGQDTYSNGIPDWWEYNYLGALTNVVSNSVSGDGFSLLQNYQRGYNPLLIHQIVDGGISRRDSAMIMLDLQPYERDAQTAVNGTLTNFYSPFPLAPTGVSFGTNAAPVVGSWSGNGLPDLFVLSQSGIQVFQNIGSAVVPNYTDVSSNFAALNGVIAGNAAPVAALGDWSQSGKAGIVIGGATGTLSFFPSTGSFSNAVTAAPAFTLQTGSGVSIPAFGNFSGGAVPDLIVMLADGTVTDYPFTGNPSQPYAASNSTANFLGTAVPNATGMTVADVNGDGIPDVLVSDATGSIWEFRGQQGGGFTLETAVWGGTGAGFASGLTITAQDLSGTGYPDVIAGTANGALVYFRNPNIGRPSGLSAQAGASSVQLSWIPETQSRLAGYNIYRSDGSTNNFTNILSAPVTLPNYLDTNVTPGVTSYYRVTALANQYLPGSSVPSVVETDPSTNVSATPGHVGISLRSRKSNVAGYVRVPVSVENAMGIAGSGIALSISYDSTVLTPASQADSNLPTVLLTGLTQGITETDNAKTATGTMTITGTSGTLNPGKGKIFSLVFKMNPKAAVGTTTTVSLTSASFTSVSGAPLTVDQGQNATVTVSPTGQLGDVNGDGVIDSNDMTLLLQLILPDASPSAAQMQAADLNGDGVLDQQDVVLLQRLLDGLPLDQGD